MLETTKENFKRIADLFLVSFIALYFEILFIRWIPSSVQIVAYFANIILISSFLGLGVGCFLANSKVDLFKFFPFTVFNLALLLKGMNNIQINASAIKNEYLLGLYPAGGVNFLPVILVIFVFNTLIFITVGQKLGNCLANFRPLVAYSVNIAGSIAGLLSFSLLSYLMFRPLYWFILGFLLTLWFYIPYRKKFIYEVIIICIALFLVKGIDRHSYWSPYYKINISPLTSEHENKIVGYSVVANNAFYQYALDLKDGPLADQSLKYYRDIYDFPYQLIRPDTVLIFGAGSGNDTAAALRAKIGDITAVEIDPFLASLGKNLHPEKPYRQKSNVTLVIDDARSFLRRSDKKYDLITFGYLDSHKVLSQFSSVRLDNFIYTKESFEDVKKHLSPGGIMSLTYYVFEEWIGDKLYAGLYDVFGGKVKVFRATTYKTDDTAIFVAGPGIENQGSIKITGFQPYNKFTNGAKYITDDWPYLYLKGKSVPAHYFVVLAAIIIISFFMIGYANPLSRAKFNSHFFFLGAGFMLLETVSIMRLALLFGSTWIVNSVVITAILFMILMANFFVEKAAKIKINLFYILLFSSLFLNWLLRPDLYMLAGRIAGIILASLVLSLPLFFAGVIFASSLKKCSDISAIFAYNLLGAIIGGVCEYISMATGFRLLFILAIIMYYLSYRDRYAVLIYRKA